MELVSLGGYGGFVWGSYVMAGVVIAAELLVLRARRKRALIQACTEASDGT
jgi:heme exporter protein CcmD